MNFLTKKLIERQMKNLPPEQKEMIMTMIEKNPKLFETITKEIKAKTKAGTDQFTASTSVMMKYKSEIQKLMQG